MTVTTGISLWLYWKSKESTETKFITLSSSDRTFLSERNYGGLNPSEVAKHLTSFNKSVKLVDTTESKVDIKQCIMTKLDMEPPAKRFKIWFDSRMVLQLNGFHYTGYCGFGQHILVVKFHSLLNKSSHPSYYCLRS